MRPDSPHTIIDNLLYSCVDKVRRGSEQFVKEHSLGYIIAGETHIHTTWLPYYLQKAELGLPGATN